MPPASCCLLFLRHGSDLTSAYSENQARSGQDPAKRQQERFEQWRKYARARVKDERGGEGPGRLGVVACADAGDGAAGRGRNVRQESVLFAGAAAVDQVCQLSCAGLSHWQWVGGECQQTGGAKSHETSGDALGTKPCECRGGYA